jgi:hypothetical protein
MNPSFACLAGASVNKPWLILSMTSTAMDSCKKIIDAIQRRCTLRRADAKSAATMIQTAGTSHAGQCARDGLRGSSRGDDIGWNFIARAAS